LIFGASGGVLEAVGALADLTGVTGAEEEEDEEEEEGEEELAAVLDVGVASVARLAANASSCTLSTFVTSYCGEEEEHKRVRANYGEKDRVGMREEEKIQEGIIQAVACQMLPA
jgi:molecular chaperone GrpE (heat shock protein)